jgi:hypothetical protein
MRGSSQFPVPSSQKERARFARGIPALARCLLAITGTPSPLVYKNHRVRGSFQAWSLKNKDLYQSIPK